MRTSAAIALAGLLALPARATADDGGSGEFPSGRAIAALLISEYVIPDVRVQLREDERLVLSWPVHLTELYQTRRSQLTAFVEPQYQPSTSDLRLVAGARLGSMPAALGGIVEGGAVLGHDAGTGGMVGLGVIILGDRPTPYLAAVGRATFLPDGERRYDLSLDVTFATVAEMIRIARE